MAGPFTPALVQNLEVATQHENFVATAATAVTVVRVLAPKAGRWVWHWCNKTIGEVEEDEGATIEDVPEALDKRRPPIGIGRRRNHNVPSIRGSLQLLVARQTRHRLRSQGARKSNVEAYCR